MYLNLTPTFKKYMIYYIVYILFTYNYKRFKQISEYSYHNTWISENMSFLLLFYRYILGFLIDIIKREDMDDRIFYVKVKILYNL